MDYLNGRPPKKVYKIRAATNTSNFFVYVLAVNEEKARKIFSNKYRAVVLSCIYYDEILK
jgi:hypothetical protein